MLFVTTRLHAIIENDAQHRNEDELDEFEVEIEKDSEDIDVDEIMNESGSIDIAEDNDYVVWMMILLKRVKMRKVSMKKSKACDHLGFLTHFNLPQSCTPNPSTQKFHQDYTSMHIIDNKRFHGY